MSKGVRAPVFRVSPTQADSCYVPRWQAQPQGKGVKLQDPDSAEGQRSSPLQLPRAAHPKFCRSNSGGKHRLWSRTDLGSSPDSVIY